MIKRFALITLIILSAAAMPFAQTARTSNALDLAFKHLTIDDGLSQGMVLAIHQDRQGFMWFGTKDGLNRYDGYRFTVFRNDPFDSTSLSNNYIQTIFEDRRGRLWIGTADGLNCFDRETEKFRRFLHDPNDPHSLSDNNVFTICEATASTNEAKGITVLWIGTLNDGLNKLVLWETPKGDRRGAKGERRGAPFTFRPSPFAQHPSPDHYFVRYRHDPRDPKTLSSNRVWDLLVDRAGVLWIGTDRGLCCLNPPQSLSLDDEQNVIFTRYVHNPKAPSSLLDNECRSLYETRDGAIWVGTARGLAKMTPVSGSPGVFENHGYPAALLLSPGPSHISGICEDRRGVLWLATYQGLMIFGAKEKIYQWIRHDSDDPASLSFDGVLSVVRARSDAVWIGTAGFGLNRWDPQATQFHKHPPEKFALDSNTGLSIATLLEDRRGVMWIFANQELYQFNRQTGSFVRHPLDFVPKGVETAFEDHAGYVWITDNTGVSRYDARSGRIEKIFPPPGALEFKLYAIYEDNDGDVWFGSYSRLSDHPEERGARSEGRRAMSEEGKAKGEMSRPSLFAPRSSPLAHHPSPFAKGESGHALYHWNRQTEKVTTYPLLIPETIKGGWLMIVRIIQDQSGVFWLGTNQGLFRFHPQSGALKIFRNEPENRASLSNNEVKTLLADPRQPERFLWLGTNGGGLNRFDVAAESFSHYTEEHGLPNNVVYGLLADDPDSPSKVLKEGRGNLWMSTNKGLSKAVLTPDTREIVRFKNYDVGDGLQSNEFNTNAYFKNGRGEMFFGGIKGFNVFHPDSIRENSCVPKVVFTDLQIRYQSVKLGQPGSPLKKTINTTETITFAPQDNSMVFEFAALDYTAPEKNLYSYKLENLEASWSRPSPHRRATYTNLKPGQYVLRVRGSNNDGVWNEEGASLKIIITPPWWKTWWAYALYGVIFFGAFYGLRRYEMNRMLWKNRVTIERLEADKMRELDRLKSRFFANISHEFRTPLTLIMGQLESMKAFHAHGAARGSPAEVKLKTKLEMAWRNAQQLLRLINQLLDLSKLEAGRMELRAAYDNIVPLLQRLTNSFESLAGLKRIQLRFESARPEIKIFHEPEKIEKIMHNLLANALKFTPAGGKVAVAVTSSSGRSSSSGSSLISSRATASATATASANCLLITVRDTGIGIPKEHLPHVFDRFYQVDSSVTREHEGTGIGLALTKELVELHGGEISVTSEEGFGTTFVVRLPFSVISDQLPVTSDQLSVNSDQSPVISEQLLVNSDQLPVISNEPRATSNQRPATSDQNVILIVEDNADLRSYLREHLEECFQVEEAGNGEEGLAKAQELVPDLVITDVMMPKMDGYTFSKHLKSDEKTSHIPIIMLTARAEEADKIAGLEIGVDDYLLKPFSPNELRVRVRNLIAIRQRLRERFSRTTLIKPAKVTVVSVDQKFLERLKVIVEANMEEEDFDVKRLSAKAGMSDRQLERKLKALIDQTPNQFLRSMRLGRAKQLLEQNAGTVSEIAFRLGFNNLSHFSKNFRDAFGVLPSEVRGEG